MKTTEERKIITIFKMIIIWTLFIAVTASGLIFAGIRTGYTNEGKESETIRLSENLLW